MTQTAKVIFNVPAVLKKRAQKKAKEQGITLTLFLNSALKSLVAQEDDAALFEKELAAARADIAAGRVYTTDEMLKRLAARS
jgi:predicted transcriptional regulator